MFKDAKEELSRLQDELLAEDTPRQPQDDDLLTEQELDDLLDTDYRSYNTDKTDIDPEVLSQELDKPVKSSLTGLIVTAGLLTLGIFLLICWCLLRYGGIL